MSVFTSESSSRREKEQKRRQEMKEIKKKYGLQVRVVLCQIVTVLCGESLLLLFCFVERELRSDEQHASG